LLRIPTFANLKFKIHPSKIILIWVTCHLYHAIHYAPFTARHQVFCNNTIPRWFFEKKMAIWEIAVIGRRWGHDLTKIGRENYDVQTHAGYVQSV
jgi:hypothetical protein